MMSRKIPILYAKATYACTNRFDTVLLEALEKYQRIETIEG